MRRSLLMNVSLVFFAVGLVVVFGSVAWGGAAANAYLRAQGGAMDASQFAVVFQESIAMYRWIGGILSILGGLGVLKTIEVR